MPALNANGPLVAGAVAKIGASVCCVGPLVLRMLGIGGAWSSYGSVKCPPMRNATPAAADRP